MVGIVAGGLVEIGACPSCEILSVVGHHPVVGVWQVAGVRYGAELVSAGVGRHERNVGRMVITPAGSERQAQGPAKGDDGKIFHYFFFMVFYNIPDGKGNHFVGNSGVFIFSFQKSPQVPV